MKKREPKLIGEIIVQAVRDGLLLTPLTKKMNDYEKEKDKV